MTATAGLPTDSDTSPSPTAIRVLICDDHRVLSDAMAMVVGLDAGFALVAEPFDRALPAVAAAAALLPDVVLMDVDLPGGVDGIEATRRISQLSPTTRVVVMSGSGDPETLLVDAIEAGAAGFLSKTEAATKVLATIRAAASGESLIDATTLTTVMRRVAAVKAARRAVDQRADRLTDRERQILQLLSEGESNEDIANSLTLSVHTVHTHVRNILMKLEFHSKLQAVAWAVRVGAITVRR